MTAALVHRAVRCRARGDGRARGSGSRAARSRTSRRTAIASRAFAERIGLPAHQKAADYTTAKQALGTRRDCRRMRCCCSRSRSAAALRHWSPGPVRSPIGPLWQDMLLIAAVAVIGGLVSLPFSWYATFVIEERFGFNRMTLALWLADIVKGIAVGVAFGLPLLLLVLWLMREAGDRCGG